MIPPRENSFYDLVGRYVHGDLSPEQGSDLLRYLDEYPDAMAIIQRNLVLDLYLDRIYTIQKKDEISSAQESQSVSLCDFIDSSDTPSRTLADLLESQFDPQVNTPIVNSDPLVLIANGYWVRESEQKKIPSTRKRILTYSGLTLCLVLLLCFTISIIRNIMNSGYDADTFRSIAVVTEVIDAKWPSEEKSLKRGQELAEGPIVLQSGIVELSYHNGTKVILNGPCEYLLRGEKNSFCSEGRISAAVSPAGKGFEIATPFGNVVDLSTEFYMEVTKTECRTDVIKGRVNFVVPELPIIPLTLGQAAQVDIHRKVREVPSSPDQYISRNEMEKRALEYTRKIESENQIRYEKQDMVPGLLASFRFDSNEIRVIPNLSQYGKDFCQKADLSGCRSNEGPLFGTRSVAFDRDNALGRCHIAGTYDSITCIVHLRIDRLVNQGNVICANSDFFDRSGSIFWQISREGKLQFFFSGQRANERIQFETPVILSRSHWGTWQKLAVVIDRTNKTVTQYYDGKMVSQNAWAPTGKLQLEDLMLGNMTANRIGKNNRNLNGAIENICIFDRALTAEEIATW